MRRLKLTVVLICSLILLSPRLSIAQTSYSSAPAYSVPTGQTFTSPPPVVYGGNTGTNYAGLAQSGGSVAGQLLNSNTAGAVQSLPGLINQIPGLNLSSQTSSLISQAGPLLGSLLSGGSLSSTLSGGISILAGSGILGSQGSQILGAAGPLLGQLLNGNLNISSVINAATGILGSLFPNNPVFGVLSGVLGGLFGGGSAGVSSTLSGIYTSPTSGTISSTVFGGPTSTSSGGSSGPNSNSVLAQTGSALCIYNNSCVQSNPSAYRPLYGSAVGAMGVADSNFVRGQITQLSRQNIKSDRFSSPFSPEEDAYFNGMKSDYETNRMSTVSTLSKEGQQALKQGVDVGIGVAKSMGELADKAYTSTRSTQGLTRANMLINSTIPAYHAADLEFAAKNDIDTQYLKIQAGNTADAVGKMQRELNSDRTAIANHLVRAAALYDKPYMY
jgi:hypothetical protein